MNKLLGFLFLFSFTCGAFASEINHKWFCVDMDSAVSGKYYSGYGDSEAMASSNFFLECNAANGLCDKHPYCDELDNTNSKAWLCETKNLSTAIHYSAFGRSKAEAMFFANRECVSNSAEEIHRDCKYIYNSKCSKQ